MAASILSSALLLTLGLASTVSGQLINLSSGLASLPRGFNYRDPETLSASEAVASFARGFQRDADAQAEVNMVAGRYYPNEPPKFLSSVPVVPIGSEQRDEEIFDFVDSRYLSPDQSQTENKPLDEVERERASLLAGTGPTGVGLRPGSILSPGSSFGAGFPSLGPVGHSSPSGGSHSNFYIGTGSSFSFQTPSPVHAAPTSAALAPLGPAPGSVARRPLFPLGAQGRSATPSPLTARPSFGHGPELHSPVHPTLHTVTPASIRLGSSAGGSHGSLPGLGLSSHRQSEHILSSGPHDLHSSPTGHLSPSLRTSPLPLTLPVHHEAQPLPNFSYSSLSSPSTLSPSLLAGAGVPRLATKQLAPVTALPSVNRSPHLQRPVHHQGAGGPLRVPAPLPRPLGPNAGPRLAPVQQHFEPEVNRNNLGAGNGNYQSFTFNHHKIL